MRSRDVPRIGMPRWSVILVSMWVAGAGRARPAVRAAPFSFVENRGQLDPRVSYYVEGRGTTAYFTAQGLMLSFIDHRFAPRREPPAIGLEFIGARHGLMPEGRRRGPPDRFHAGLPTYGEVVYPDVWPGIDLTWSGSTGRMKYTFLVRPGADPRR